MNLHEDSAVQPLRVALEGVDERARVRLTKFLATISNDSCEVVATQDAEVVLVNISTHASVSYEDFSARTGIVPTVILAHDNPGVDERFFVQKPLRGKPLVRAIRAAQKLYWELSAAIEQTDEEVTFADFDFGAAEIDVGSRQPERSESGLYYDPASGLTGLLSSAVTRADTEGTPYLVDLNHGRYLLYRPEQQTVGMTISDSELKGLSEDDELTGAVRLAKLGEVELLEADQLEKGLLTHSLTSVLWKTHAWHSRGRLPEGTEVDLRVVLARWPNFTGLLRLPHDMAISHLWVEEPMSFAETVATLDVGAPQVYCFYSAAFAAGLAHAAHREEDYLIAESAMGSAQPGFFGRLASHFGRDKGL